MAGMQFDVKAQTQNVEASLRRMTAELNKLGTTVARISRQKFSPIDEKELGGLQKAEESLRQIMQMHPSIRSAVKASKQDPATPTAVNWSQVPLTAGQVRTMMQHLGGGAQRFSRPEVENANRIGDAVSKSLGRFFSGMGGGAGSVGGAAANGMSGGGGFGGLLKGGMIGAGLFAAYKAGQELNEGYDNAKALALEMDTLKRRMGDIGVSFGTLMSAAEMSARGLEVNSVEAGKLMAEFNKLSGGVKDTADLVGGTRAGTGMSKALGLDPSQGVSFLANMRNITRGGSADGDRRLALMIGDVVTRSGMNARADEVLQAVQQFASATSRISLSAPNAAGFGGAYAGLLSAKIPGLTPEVAAAMLGQANSSMQGMGAMGEASETFTMSAFARNGGALNPIQSRVLAEGGLFGTREGAFGNGSVYRRYMKSEGKSDAEIDAMMGSGGGTNFESIRKQLDSMNVAPELKAEMAKNFFGLSSINQAMALMSTKPEAIGRTEKLMSARGFDLKDLNETGIMTMSKIANAGGMGDLQSVASDMLGRRGKGALDAKQKEMLERALKDSAAGGPADFARLQDTLADLSANKDKQQTLGSQMLDQQKRIETAMTTVGKDLLGPMVDVKELLMAKFGMTENKARDMANELRKKEANEEFDTQTKGETDKYLAARLALGNRRAMSSGEGRAAVEQEMKALDDAFVQNKRNIEAARGRRMTEIDAMSARGSSKAQFLSDNRAGAEAAGAALGVDPKLLLAQAGLETGWGKSTIPGTNNLGNIKAGKGWKGETKRAYDKAEGSYDAYRVYGSTDEYWKDYVGLIKRKYPGVVGAGSDAGRFAKGLKDGGYATDPDYENKIVRTASGVGDVDQKAAQPPSAVMSSSKSPMPVSSDINPSSKTSIPLVGEKSLRGTLDNIPRQSQAPSQTLIFRLMDEKGRERAAPVSFEYSPPAAAGSR